MRALACAAFAAALSLSAMSCHASTAQETRASPQPTDKPPMENCDLPKLADKEACYARQSADAIAACEQMRLYRCAPYKQVHDLEQQLQALNADVEAAARKQYAGYTDNDQAYLDDLAEYLRDSDRTWRAYRDASCLLEPFVQGMSRSEAGDLTEQCRAERTKARVSELKEIASSIKAEGVSP